MKIQWIWGFALVLFLSACQSSTEQTVTRAVTDDLGREVHIPLRVDRIVTLAPSITEIVYVAGAGSKLVGVTTADDHPPQVEALPRFGALPVDFEAILALQPDLVLATDQINSPADADVFASFALPVYFFSFDGLQGMLGAIRQMGTLLSVELSAAAAADSLAASINALEHHMLSVTDRPSTLFLIDDETLYAFGRGSYMHGVIALAGGESITASFPKRAPVLNDEFVLLSRPQVIVGSFGADYDIDILLQKHPTWDIVPAVVNGRICGLNPGIVLRPGPRLVEGAWRMAVCLHPSLFTADP